MFDKLFGKIRLAKEKVIKNPYDRSKKQEPAGTKSEKANISISKKYEEGTNGFKRLFKDIAPKVSDQFGEFKSFITNVVHSALSLLPGDVRNALKDYEFTPKKQHEKHIEVDPVNMAPNNLLPHHRTLVNKILNQVKGIFPHRDKIIDEIANVLHTDDLHTGSHTPEHVDEIVNRLAEESKQLNTQKTEEIEKKKEELAKKDFIDTKQKHGYNVDVKHEGNHNTAKIILDMLKEDGVPVDVAPKTVIHSEFPSEPHTINIHPDGKGAEQYIYSHVSHDPKQLKLDRDWLIEAEALNAASKKGLLYGREYLQHKDALPEQVQEFEKACGALFNKLFTGDNKSWIEKSNVWKHFIEGKNLTPEEKKHALLAVASGIMWTNLYKTYYKYRTAALKKAGANPNLEAIKKNILDNMVLDTGGLIPSKGVARQQAVDNKSDMAKIYNAFRNIMLK